MKLICATPTSPVGIPANCTVAVTPPTVITTACCGAGNCATDVVTGAAPVATAGETAPMPGRYSVAMLPRAAVAAGTSVPPALRIPGAAAGTVNAVRVVRAGGLMVQAPLYCAIIAFGPIASGDALTVMLAVALDPLPLSVAEPRALPPERNVIDPVGAVPLVPVTVALTVTVPLVNTDAALDCS